MTKEELLKEKEAFLEWVSSLELNERLWFQPFSEGKWATADVVSHFISWDRFILEHRFPYIDKGVSFPKLDVNVEKVNKDASIYARSGVSKENLINEFLETRKLLLSIFTEMSEDQLHRIIKNGKSEVKIIDYFHSLLEHDLKHKQQIITFLEKAKEIELKENA